MQRILFAAASLLILQIGLVLATQFKDDDLKAFTPEEPFLEFTPETVTSIEITGAEGEELVLQKREAGWILPFSISVPADQQQINDFINKLADLKQGLAVATSKEAAKRFKLTADDFERHLVLKEGDKTMGDFYLGSSSGLRKSHARKQDHDEIITITLGSYEVEPKVENWLDKNQLKVAQETIEGITAPQFTLTKNEESWRLIDQPEKELNTDEVANLLDTISNIIVQSVIDPEKASALYQENAPITIQLTLAGGKNIDYSFVMGAEENSYVLKVSDRDLYYKIYSFPVEELQEVTLEKLLAPMQEEEKEGGANS